MIKILFFGSGKLSGEYNAALADCGFDIIAVSKKIIPPVSELKALHPDIGVIAYYGKIIPQEILEIPKHKTVNIHHSLLPRWRGPSPVQSAILAGDEKTGVTIALATKKVDAGDIVAQKEIDILPHDTYLYIEHRLIEIGSMLLYEILPRYADGGIELKPQNELQSTYSHIITKENGRIDWSQPAENIERMTRAFTPWPGAWTIWHNAETDKRIRIDEADVLTETSYEALPGTVWKTSDEHIFIQTGKDTLGIKKLTLEGKKTLHTEAFLRGYALLKGSLLV